VPTPEVNATTAGLEVDALWRERRLIVELDGHRFHAHPAEVERDRDREPQLRSSGYGVVRYTWRQVAERPEAVIAELRRELALSL
jgi:very-short-patch-repair endonuclease